jgi:autoinducer 2-degrading protein
LNLVRPPRLAGEGSEVRRQVACLLRVKQAVALTTGAEGGSEMFAAYVTIDVKPNDMEKFLEACIEEGRASVRDEPDCYRFEILRDKNDPNRICFIEVFENEQALQTHWETPHFSKMWRTVENMIDADVGRTDLWNSVGQTDMEFVYTSDDYLGT